MSETAVGLTYSAEILDRELVEASEDFTNSLQAESLSRLFGNAVTKEIAAANRSVKERLASPFSIMVVGDFKRGKSTLINALVGQDVAPVDVQPETMSINRIEYSEQFSARLQSKDGGEASLSREDLRRERLEPLLRRLSTPLRHLRVGVPAPILEKVTLVDTPGLGDLFKEFDQLVREYMEQADTILYVLSSTSPLSATEQDFLRIAIAPRHFPKVFFVVNAADVFANDQEQQRLMDMIRGKLSHIMPGCSVYCISALDEWSRVSGGARPRPARAESLEKQFAEFRRDLDEAIEFRRRYFVLDRAAFAFSNTVNLVGQRATGLEAALQRDKDQLDAAVHALEQRRHTKSKEFEDAGSKLEKGFERLRREGDVWMSEFVDRLDEECIHNLSILKASQIRQHMPFFLKDRLRRGIEACLVTHESEIVNLIDEYASGMNAEATRMLQTKTVPEKTAPMPEQRWSNLQTAELVAQFLQVGFLLQVGLAIFARQQRDAQSAQLADAFSKTLPQLREELRQQVRDSYTNVKNQLVEEWTRRHEEELKGHLEDMKQALHLRESGAVKVEDSQAKLAEVRELVRAKQEFLEQFRRRSGPESPSAPFSSLAMNVPIRVPHVVAPGTRLVVDSVAIQTGAKVAAGDLLLTVRIGSLPASLHCPVTGVVQDVRAASGDQLTPGRIALWVESDALPPMESAPVAPKASGSPAGPGTVVFHLPELLLPARVPKVHTLLAQPNQSLAAGDDFMEVSLGIVRFRWTSPVSIVVKELLVKPGDDLSEGMPLLETVANTSDRLPTSKLPSPTLEIPDLSLPAFRQRTRQLLEHMTQLSELVCQSGLPHSAQLLQAEIARLETARFTVAVVGEFKRGKSTFLNALAGGEVLPNDVVPCTAFACRFQYGERLQLLLLGNNGEETISTSQTIRAMAAELDRLTRDPEAAIREAIIRMPLEICRDGVDLVDTPGLNDSEAMNHVTLSVLPNVDAAVLLLIPENPLSDTEQRFLQDHLLEGDIGRVLFVLNAKDRVRPGQLTRLTEYLQRRIQEIVAAREPSATADAKLVCVSSRAELDHEPDSGFDELRQHLNHVLLRQRGRLLLLQSLQRVRRAVSESLAAVQLRMSQLAASREGFLASLSDVERELATTRLYSNDLRLRLMEAQSQAEARAASQAKQLYEGLLSLRESLPPQVTLGHTEGGPEKVGARLGSALRQNAGRYFQHSVTALITDVRAVYEPIARQIRAFIERAYASLVTAAAPAESSRTTGELAMPELLTFGAGLVLRVDLSIGALSWLFLMESANSLLSRGDLHQTLETRALQKLRVSYGQEIERQVKTHASEATLTLRFHEFARRPFNELMLRLDQELKALLDDAWATLGSLRQSAGQGGDVPQMEHWKTIHAKITAAAERCEAIVFAPGES